MKISRGSRRTSKTGMPPGALIHVGERKAERTSINVIHYDEGTLLERETATLAECAALKDTPRVTWIDVDGLHQVEVVQGLGECFGLHPLTLEDILTTGQRPKLEDFGDYVYIVLQMLRIDRARDLLESEQMSLVLGRNFVLSFQEQVGDVFDPVRERLRNGIGRLRKSDADYLAYSLLDAIIDNYFLVIERLGERIEALEEVLVTQPGQATLQQIHVLNTDMLDIRRAVWPFREVVSALQRGESPLIQDSTRVYLSDVYDHTVQAIDTTETFRDIVSGMLDIYLSSVSLRLNEVMKFLTIISTIFMPLTFLAGVYGMNFVHMPELRWEWGYPLVLLVMFATAGVMLVYFRRKRWL